MNEFKALCISILVEHIDLNNNVNSNTTNVNSSSSSKKFDLDTIDEYKQLTPALQALIKDKRIQYTRAKELQRLKQKRKEFRGIKKLSVNILNNKLVASFFF